MKRTSIATVLAAGLFVTAGAFAEGNRMGDTNNQRMSSDTVRQVQQALQSKGHNVGGIDGVLGPNTESALRDYQRAQGIDATGRADDKTLSSLGISGMDSSRNMNPSSGGQAGPSSAPSAGGMGSQPAR